MPARSEWIEIAGSNGSLAVDRSPGSVWVGARDPEGRYFRLPNFMPAPHQPGRTVRGGPNVQLGDMLGLEQVAKSGVPVTTSSSWMNRPVVFPPDRPWQ